MFGWMVETLWRQVTPQHIISLFYCLVKLLPCCWKLAQQTFQDLRSGPRNQARKEAKHRTTQKRRQAKDDNRY